MSIAPDWVVAYKKDWLRPDIVAGLVAAAVVIPKALAFATIAGLPVEVGLYTAFLPLAIYACVGTSPPLSVSTTTTIAMLAATALGGVAATGDLHALASATATLSLLVGAMLVIASVLRLGFIADFISEPVLVGFKAGIGVVIVVDQIPKILGIHFPKSTFLHNLVALAHAIPETAMLTMLVGVGTIVVLVALEHFFPRVPAPLIAVAGGIAIASAFGLAARGVQLTGHIPQGLPPVTMPDLSLASGYWPAALGIALMSFTESIAAGRAFAGRDEQMPRANRELVAIGLANVGGAFLGAMPAGGGTTQTAVNRAAGARSQVAELVTAGVALATMLLLAPMVALMPQATLAAVVIVASIGLIRPAEFRAIAGVRRTEFIWALTAFSGVVLLGTLKGIVVAIAVSLVALAYQASNPPVYVLGRKRGTNVFRPRSSEHPDDETFPGLLMLRLEGRIFFANAGHVSRKIQPLVEEANPKVVVIDFRAVPDLEYTALKMLKVAEQRYRERGIAVWLAGLNPEVLTVIRRSGLAEDRSREMLLFNLEAAVSRYLGLTTN
jgi:high affinity sulfate transporter 1